MTKVYDVIIIGSGVAGLGAAIYCGRFQLKTLVIGEKPGGTIVLTDDIANYPGFKKITGIELTEKILEHAKDYEIDIDSDRVDSVTKKAEGFLVKTTKSEYVGLSLILATGTEWRKLNVPGEKEFTGRGVHYCALCDGTFYKNAVVAVVGGSDSAAKEALLLTQYCKKVYIIYRGEKIRPEPINMKRVLANPKIEIINNANVKEIKGDKFVKSVLLDRDFAGSHDLALDGVFVDIGHIPLSSLAEQIGVALTSKKEIIIDQDSRTNIPGFFAAGDVCNNSFKQAITGVAEGVKAANSAYNYVQLLKGE
jgi:thioredoxin reductase (NADPH)